MCKERSGSVIWNKVSHLFQGMSFSSHWENIHGPPVCQPWGRTLIAPRKQRCQKLCCCRLEVLQAQGAPSCLQEPSSLILLMVFERHVLNVWHQRVVQQSRGKDLKRSRGNFQVEREGKKKKGVFPCGSNYMFGHLLKSRLGEVLIFSHV